MPILNNTSRQRWGERCVWNQAARYKNLYVQMKKMWKEQSVASETEHRGNNAIPTRKAAHVEGLAFWLAAKPSLKF